MPSTVTGASDAFFSACLNTTTRRRSPFDSAVRM